MKASVAVRNAMLDAIETAIGTSAVLKIRTGAAPTNITDADSGTVLASLTLPSDWLAAAASGAKAKAGTWQDLSADNSGTAGHWRIYASDGTTQHLQGSVGSGSGELDLSTLTFVAGQSVTINTATLTAGNA